MVRFLDFFLSLLGILILSPLFIILFFLLKFTGEGEIFYMQERIGANEKKFKLIKFATMKKNSSKIGSRHITVKDDPRILSLGKILRDTKINELPQLFNVLLGDMSLVGPRPLVGSGYLKYPENIKKSIKKIKPGLSGLASLILRNEEHLLSLTSNPIDFHSNVLTPFKGETEVWFYEKKSLFNYLKILFLTIWIVFFPKSNILERVFKKRPEMPQELKNIFISVQKNE